MSFFLTFGDFVESGSMTGSTISTLLHDRINPKDCQVLSLGDTGFLQFFRVVSRDYGKPRMIMSFCLKVTQFPLPKWWKKGSCGLREAGSFGQIGRLLHAACCSQFLFL